MVRKQLYLEAEQDARLKSLARTTGRTEAQVVRDALDGLERMSGRVSLDGAAWDEAVRFMKSRGSVVGRPRRKRAAPASREDLYREMVEGRGRRAR